MSKVHVVTIISPIVGWHYQFEDIQLVDILDKETYQEWRSQFAGIFKAAGLTAPLPDEFNHGYNEEETEVGDFFDIVVGDMMSRYPRDKVDISTIVSQEDALKWRDEVIFALDEMVKR